MVTFLRCARHYTEPLKTGIMFSIGFHDALSLSSIAQKSGSYHSFSSYFYTMGEVQI